MLAEDAIKAAVKDLESKGWQNPAKEVEEVAAEQRV